MLETPETPAESETGHNVSMRPEVRDFVNNVTDKGILRAIVELNATGLDRDEREDVIPTALDILVSRQKNNQYVGEAETFAKQADVLKRRKRGSHIINIFRD